MIYIRSEEELSKLRRAGQIVALTHQELKKHLVPGVTTLELDTIAEAFIRKCGATPSFKGLYGFPASICTSINQVLVHGIPGKTILKEGDIIAIDIGACYKGYHGDSAWSYGIGNISEEAKRLLQVTEASLYAGLAQAKEGNRVSDISHAVQQYVEAHGYSVPRDYTGHGVGTSLHEDPVVPNFGLPNRGAKLAKGMVLAIEPMVHQGAKETRVLSDDWTVVSYDGSLTAHFEHTIAILEDGYEILTKL
jgi:methionyl aminopeptidase